MRSVYGDLKNPRTRFETTLFLAFPTPDLLTEHIHRRNFFWRSSQGLHLHRFHFFPKQVAPRGRKIIKYPDDVYGLTLKRCHVARVQCQFHGPIETCLRILFLAPLRLGQFPGLLRTVGCHAVAFLILCLTFGTLFWRFWRQSLQFPHFINRKFSRVP